jgi:predicted acetyltransferase
MTTPSITVTKVGADADPIVTNLFEHYLHDMAEWFEFDTREDGRYGYDMSLHRSRGDQVFLARVGNALAGFAITSTVSKWLQPPETHDVMEFFVMRRYRRSGVGATLATTIWDENPGRWLVRVLERNAPALPFWRTIISTYANNTQVEERRLIDDNLWTFFRFDSRRP